MDHRTLLLRRTVLGSAVALGGAALASAAGAIPPFTPNQVMGPFYPVEKPLDQDSDLTTIAGRSGQAEGQVVHFMGRVLNSLGHPVAGARIEIWQANTHGRYSHPADSNPAPLDPNFEGYGIQETDDEGRYHFKTIRPGAYPVSDTWTRPPHIHVDVAGRTGRIMTQVYFEDEPLNDVDQLLMATRDPQALIAGYQPPTGDMDPQSLIAAWDAMLPEA